MTNVMFHTSEENKPRFKQQESTFTIIISVCYCYIKYQLSFYRYTLEQLENIISRGVDRVYQGYFAATFEEL